MTQPPTPANDPDRDLEPGVAAAPDGDQPSPGLGDMATQGLRHRLVGWPGWQEFWPRLTAIALGLLSGGILLYATRYQFPIAWDEARHINRLIQDLRTLSRSGPLAWLGELFTLDRVRPPALRLQGLPVGLLVGANPVALRLSAWLTTLLALAAMAIAAGRLVGPSLGPARARAVAALAVLLLALCPQILGPSAQYMSEPGLLLGIAATLLALFWNWDRPATSPRRWGWVGLGLALGWGTWAKLTFFVIAGPMLLAVLALGGWGVIATPRPPQILKGMALGSAIAAAWWLPNWQPGLGFAQLSYAEASYHSVGSSSGWGGLRWLAAVAQGGLGLSVALVVALTLGAVVWAGARGRLGRWAGGGQPEPHSPAPGRLERTAPGLGHRRLVTALAVLAAGTLPLLVLSAMGTNNSPRLLAPAFVTGLLAIALLLELLGLLHRWRLAIAAVLGVQLWLILTPSLTHQRRQGDAIYQPSNGILWRDPSLETVLVVTPGSVLQTLEDWDLRPLPDLWKQRIGRKPTIGVFANDPRLNAAQVRWAALQRGGWLEVVTLPLPDRANRSPNWPAILAAADRSDVVITVGLAENRAALDYPAFRLRLNQHNDGLIERLVASGRFDSPLFLTVGRESPVRLAVLLRRP